ncbi:hypothetical protein BH23ACT12_BH23ACT12_15090 [soil metagenome]
MFPGRRFLALAALVALLLSACGDDERTGGAAARLEKGAASASPSAVAESLDEDAQTTVRIHQLRLRVGAEEGGNSVRILVNPSTPNLRITLTGDIDQDSKSVTVCSVADPISIPPSTQCVLPVAGRPVDLPARPGIRGAEISLAGRSTLVDLQEVALSYTAADRTVQFRLPNLDPAPQDAACAPLGCPSFEIYPARAGKLEATARWDQPGSALLDVRAAVFAPTGVAVPTPRAYRVVTSSSSSSDSGPGLVTIAATIRSRDSSILALTNNGSGPLQAPVLQAAWP